MDTLKIIGGWLYWALYQIISFFFFLPLGVVLVGLASIFKAWEQRASRYPYADGRVRYQWIWWLFPLWLWCNEEDGIANTGNVEPTRLGAFKWSAIRNSANNMRCLPGAFFTCGHNDVTFKDYSWGYIATRGWRQCIQWNGFRIGWLIPRTANDGSDAWPVVTIPRKGS